MDKDHFEVHLSDEHKANLLKLADYLETNVPKQKFNMTVYMTHEGHVMDFYEVSALIESNCHKCGTIACAAGYGPIAGIMPKNTKAFMGWLDYVEAAFGLHYITDAFDWCFDANWYRVDNTPQGAAKRIRYMLEHGVPYNLKEQMNKIAPLSY